MAGAPPSGREHGRRFELLLVVMVALRWLMLTLLVMGVPRFDLRDDWFIYPAHDQQIIFYAAYMLATRGVAQRTVAGLGQIVVMLVFYRAQDWPLWVRVIRPWTGRHVRWISYVDILPELMLFNGFLLGGLSILLVGMIARALTGRKAIGAGVAGVWLAYPYLIGVVKCLHLDPGGHRADLVPTVAGLNGLSDGPGVFCVLLSTWLAWLCLERRRTWLAVALGAALALSVTFRAVTLPVAVWIGAVVAIRLGWRAALAMSGAALIAYIPQALYNQAAFGFPFTSGYLYVGAQPGVPRNLSTDPLSTFLHFDPRYAAEAARQLVTQCPSLTAILPVIGLMVATGFVGLWRRRGWESAALLAAPLPYLAIVVTFIGFRHDPVRFTLLAHPYLLTAGAYALWLAVRRTQIVG